MQVRSQFPALLILVTSTISLVACGSGTNNSGTTSNSQLPISGVFLDSPVQGLYYETKSRSGITNESGEFKFLKGETITFFVGRHKLPVTKAKPSLTPLDLANTSSLSDTTVVNILRFLQTLDNDNNPENGINLSESIHTASENPLIIDFTSDNFEDEPGVLSILRIAKGDGSSLIDEEAAVLHFGKSLVRNIHLESKEELAILKNNGSYFMANEDGNFSGDTLIFTQGSYSLTKDGKKEEGKYAKTNNTWHLWNQRGKSHKFFNVSLDRAGLLKSCWGDSPEIAITCNNRNQIYYLFASQEAAENFQGSEEPTLGAAHGTVVIGTPDEVSGSDEDSDGDSSPDSDNQMQLPAFPGAQGFGAKTIGGRGGQVYLVTNLNNSGPGSLRQCAEASGSRICVFRTGGLITLESSIEIDSPFITIAGQSAPGGGISIRTQPDYPKAAIKVKTHDVVIRYLRVRPGASYVVGDTQDAITIANLLEPVYNVIVDHSSLSWASDEVAQVWYDAHDITFQWNIIAEGLDCMNHPKGCNHSKGLLVGGDGSHNISIHHNLFAHHSERNPRMSMSGIADVVNNVIYNPQYSGSQATDEHGIVQVNYVGNYMKKGIDSTSDYLVSPKFYNGHAFELFLEGNIADVRPENSLAENLVVKPREFEWEINTRHAAPPVTNYPCESMLDCVAYDEVLSRAGAILPKRDAVDKRIVAEVKTGTGKILDAQSEYGCYLDCRKFLSGVDYTLQGISDALTHDGWPILEIGQASADNDFDGMPDYWESIHGLNSNLDDSFANDLHEGYTNIELFLNELADTAPPLNQ